MPSTVVEKSRDFLWWLACTDPDAIRLCSPVTRFYQTTAGVMILITGLLAFISGTYAIFQVVRGLLPAALLGCVYSTAIISIDRYIVSGRGGRIAWFRLPLALLLGCVMAAAAAAARKADDAQSRRQQEESAAAERKRQHLLEHPEDCPFCAGRGKHHTDSLPEELRPRNAGIVICGCPAGDKLRKGVHA